MLQVIDIVINEDNLKYNKWVTVHSRKEKKAINIFFYISKYKNYFFKQTFNLYNKLILHLFKVPYPGSTL